MRSDPGQDFGGVGSNAVLPGRAFQDGVSQSGRERNHLFANLGGARFADVSGVSGLDSPADGRAFAWLDADRDGRLDVVAVNANAPRVQLFQNRIDHALGRSISIALSGGNDAPAPSDTWSARSPIGARITALLPDGTRLERELTAGAGLAAQNTARLVIGLGDAERAELRVDWPSGRSHVLGEVRAGAALSLGERSEAARIAGMAAPAAYEPAPSRGAAFPVALSSRSPAQLRLVTTFATWCEICRGELPRIAALRAAFPEDVIAFDGVPVDLEDGPEKLARWLEAQRPAYRVRDDLSGQERVAIATAVRQRFRRDALPASFVLDASGAIVHAQMGVPTLSGLRRVVEGQGERR